MSKEQFIKRAKEVKKITYNPEGKDRDFSQYRADPPGVELLGDALEAGVVDEETLREMSIKSGGQANEYCGNHWLLNLFKHLGIKIRK